MFWNRHFAHSQTQRINARHVASKLRELGIEPLNPTALGNLIGSKDAFQRYLQDDPQLRRYSPETQTLAEPSIAEKYLNKYSTVYLKPSVGTKGQGIVKCWKSKGMYHYSLMREGKTVEGQAKTIGEMLHSSGVNYQERKYICQQGLELARSGGNIFDIRILVQKADGRKWRLTGMAARVAGSATAVTSNLHTGGKASQVTEVLTPLFSAQKTQEIQMELEKLGLLLSGKIERTLGMPYFETGIDVGVDVNGRVWIIEANPKPGKQIFLDTGQQDKRIQACSAALSNACFRSGYIS